MRNTLLYHTIEEMRVAGLREVVLPGEVRTFALNPDGSKGPLIKIEPPVEFYDLFYKKFNTRAVWTVRS